MVGAKGFEPSTSWSRTRDKNHLSRCPGVSYSFSGRSLLDKFGQVGLLAVVETGMWLALNPISQVLLPTRMISPGLIFSMAERQAGKNWRR
jgi:hypothetical protein